MSFISTLDTESEHKHYDMAMSDSCIKHSKKVDFTALLSGWPMTNCWSTFYKVAEELTYRRNRLLTLTNPKDKTQTSVGDVLKALEDYYRQPIESLVAMANNPQNVTFYWTNLLGPHACTSDCVAFERGSMLLRVALWLRNHGHQVSDPRALVKSASILQFMLEMDTEPIIAPDLARDSIQALVFQISAEILVMKILINADVQSSTFLQRACQDAVTAARHVSLAGQLIDETFDRAKKWKLYLLYKYELYTSLSHILQSKMVLENGRAGDAVSCSNSAKTRCSIAGKVSRKYEKTSPRCKTKPTAEEETQRILEQIDKQTIESETQNATCNQKIPQVASKLEILPVQPQIHPEITVYHLPKIEILRINNTAERETTDEEGSSCTDITTSEDLADISMGSCAECCHYTYRLVVFILCVPFLLLLGLLGILLSIVILPFRCCCPCCGPCLKAFVDGLMWLLKAPFQFLLWATRSKDFDDGETVELTKKPDDS